MKADAVGVPETFEFCADLVRPGGHVANVGVHGHPATLHLERLWIRDLTIMTGLVGFPLDEAMAAYDTFAAAAETNALNVVLEAEPVPTELLAREGAAVGA